MTAVSLSVNRGVDGFTISDVTIGSTAPVGGDIMLAFQLNDQNSVPLTREDILIRAFNAFRTALIQGQGLQAPAGTAILPRPVL
jgi:hypothetical protein